MVLIDFNGIGIGSVMGQLGRGVTLSDGLIKHVILNNIRIYRNKFPKEEYGRLVICCDSYNNWRKEVYPEYKARRKKTRDTDKFDWTEIFRLIDITKEDIRNNFPYPVIEVNRAEADDIIGALTVFGTRPLLGEKVAIVSADKDFIQLHRHGDVIQWSPLFNKWVKEDDPTQYIFEHILKGDSGDGVPNILSPDNSFTDSIRQKPMTKKRMAEIKENMHQDKMGLDNTIFKNFVRNTTMIHLDRTPEDLKEESIRQFENYKYPNKGNVLTYLIENDMKMLIECAGEF
jgi:hypothetical protein